VYRLLMPEITVSEELYRQIRSETTDEDIDKTLWKMVGTYRRSNNPQAK
jgi:hypothetical protein